MQDFTAWLQSGEWITPFIHVWAGLTFVLVIIVYIAHRRAIVELSHRIGHVEGFIENKPPTTVAPEKMGGLLLYLGDKVHKMDPDKLTPIVQYIRQEEKAKSLRVQRTLVNITETMIELFPILGIFGTVWGFAGTADANASEFGSAALLDQFAIAIFTTLYGLLYFMIYRLLYAGMIQAKITALDEHSKQFQEFLSALERRSSEGSPIPDEETGDFWEGHA